jgi:3-phosphoshikimate 1-carboxyvinyltransferase
MNVIITPHSLGGMIDVPSSKSMGHRDLICAALAQGQSYVDNISPSQDIDATCSILRTLGILVENVHSHQIGRVAYRIQGGLQQIETPIVADCGESGSTLRFLIPLCVLSGNTVTFIGRGRLADRPLNPYFDLFRKQGIHFEVGTEGKCLPLTVHGSLQPGMYELPGNVSSQFFTGLLLALPLLSGDSTLISTTSLESKSYIDMTIACMERHGVHINSDDRGRFFIPGNQHYHADHYNIEGDYSQAAFWLSAGILSQKPVMCKGLRPRSSQGDMAIISILRQMGGHLSKEGASLSAQPSTLAGRTINVEDCPDLTPILTVLAACSKGMTHIVQAGRVRLKECDRLHAMTVELNKIGADVQEEPEGLIVYGVDTLRGGTVSAWNDHRIAMALAIASQRCSDNLTIEGAECVGKSYPEFWKDFARVGGVFRQEG